MSKNVMEKLKPLLKASYFTSKEARKFGVSSASLAYYVNRGDLIRIGHGIYRSSDITTTEDFRWEDLVDVVSKVKKGVVCLSTALAIYGLSDEMPKQHWIAISNDTSHRADAMTKIVRLRNMVLGQTTYNLDGFKLPIFDKERTIVDAFRLLSLEIALKALRYGLKRRGEDKINISKICRYAKILHVNIEPYIHGIVSE